MYKGRFPLCMGITLLRIFRFHLQQVPALEAVPHNSRGKACTLSCGKIFRYIA